MPTSCVRLPPEELLRLTEDPLLRLGELLRLMEDPLLRLGELPEL